MYAQVLSAAVSGIDADIIQVEVHLDSTLPKYTTVGLPDNAVRESRERVSAAIKNSNFLFPQKRITVNLAPAGLKKEGASFDLPIAIGILAASGQINPDALNGVALLGELALDGTLRPVRGALSIASALPDNDISTLILPSENAKEAAMIEKLDVIPANSLSQVISFLNGEAGIDPVEVDIEAYFESATHYSLDFKDVKGQEIAKRALEIAAAGGHNILMIGPPGSGKTMLAKRLPTIMPNLSLEESLETTKIYSVSGLLALYTPLLTTRPFRNPHHTVSYVGLIGGGAIPRPGEVSLSHKGVLFLDELPEFSKHVLEMLRQPMEDGDVTITRSKMTVNFPSNFMLVAAMNPCPCGYFGHPTKECRCNAAQVQRYLNHISGPLLDRIDIHIEVPAVDYKQLTSDSASETSIDVKERVVTARNVQAERYKRTASVSVNGDIASREIRKHCKVDKEGAELLKNAIDSMGLSARAYDRILKVARTIADLEGSPQILPSHLAEAIQYRNLDRELWL